MSRAEDTKPLMKLRLFIPSHHRHGHTTFSHWRQLRKARREDEEGRWWGGGGARRGEGGPKHLPGGAKESSSKCQSRVIKAWSRVTTVTFRPDHLPQQGVATVKKGRGTQYCLLPLLVPAAPRQAAPRAGDTGIKPRFPRSSQISDLNTGTLGATQPSASRLRVSGTSDWLSDRLVGLVVKVSASRAEDPGFDSRKRRDFFRIESY